MMWGNYMVWNRVIVIDMLCKKKLAAFTKGQREDILLDWWGLDDEEEAFGQLSDELKSELLASEAPLYNVMQKRYDPLILLALKKKYEGVREMNQYSAANHMTLSEGRRQFKQSDTFNIGICKYLAGKTTMGSIQDFCQMKDIF